MGCTIKLSDIQNVALILQDSSFIVVYIEIVRGGEEGHHRWKACSPGFPVHSVTRCRELSVGLMHKLETYPAS
jgi:hypothetical protein